MCNAAENISVAVDQHLETGLTLNVSDLADVFNRGETKDFRQSVGVMVSNSEIIEIPDVVNDQLATDSVHMHWVLCRPDVAEQCCISDHWHRSSNRSKLSRSP